MGTQDLAILRLAHSHDLGIAEMISKVSIVVCLLLAAPFLAYGIKCYQCNSAEDKDCMDPFVDEPINDGEKPKVKDAAKGFLNDCPAEATVIRSCATEEYKNECYKTVLEEYNTLSCTCKEDECNHAPASLASLATIALMALVAVAL